ETLPLFTDEEEEFVLDDGTSNEAAEVVEDKLGGLGGEVVTGVEVVVADDLECAAVEGVRTALSDYVEGGARGAAELGGGVGGIDLELLDEVRTDVAHER